MTNTRKMAYIAILSAVSFLLMYLAFPLIPTAPFLKADFSIIPILIGLILLDVKSSFAILFLRTVLKLILNNEGPTTWIGLPMNIAAMTVFILAVAFLWKKKDTVKDYLLAAVVATLGSTLVMVVLNYFYAIPAYAAFGNFDISKKLGVANYLVAMVIPFNFLQGVLLSAVFYIFYIAFRPYLKKM